MRRSPSRFLVPLMPLPYSAPLLVITYSDVVQSVGDCHHEVVRVVIVSVESARAAGSPPSTISLCAVIIRWAASQCQISGICGWAFWPDSYPKTNAATCAPFGSRL
jgi:hypothetical protein